MRSYRNRGSVLDAHGAKRTERGFSLIELMIALVVLAVGMAALGVLFGVAILGNGRSKGDTAGTMLAQTILNRLRRSRPAAPPTSVLRIVTLRGLRLGPLPPRQAARP